MAEEKTDIARRAAELIPDNSSLFINIGTTTERVAEYLSNRNGLLVVTNNINVAAMLWPARGLEVMIASGSVRRSDGGIVGAGAEEFVSKFKLDYAVIGCSAIDEDGDFFDFDLREVRVTQAIMQHARAIILVTDSMKFERRAPIRIGNLSEVDTLVTDEGLPAEALGYCRENEVELVTVSHLEDSPTVAGKG
jgi:DeoR family glycerol-3-phosphate regulon repressor